MAKQYEKGNKAQAGSGKQRATSKSKGIELPFDRDNFILMGVGFVVLIIGYILMSGDTNIYSFQKITLAPVIVMFGYALEVYAILKPAKQHKAESAEDNPS